MQAVETGTNTMVKVVAGLNLMLMCISELCLESAFPTIITIVEEKDFLIIEKLTEPLSSYQLRSFHSSLVRTLRGIAVSYTISRIDSLGSI